VAERERDLRRIGKLRTDKLLSLKRPKQLKSKIKPSLIKKSNFRRSESFSNPQQVSVPVFATPEQSRVAKALGYTPAQLLDALSNQYTTNQLGTVEVRLRDGTVARLPRTLPRVESVARRYVETLGKEAQAVKRRQQEADVREFERIRARQISRQGVPRTAWNISRAQKPLRRGKR
jgi:hypothetical protein